MEFLTALRRDVQIDFILEEVTGLGPDYCVKFLEKQEDRSPPPFCH
jgi:hypothetical protein